MDSVNITDEDYWDALDSYFAEPDVTGCFTIQDISDRYYDGRRNKAVGHIRRAVKAGKVEFVGKVDGQNYYRFVG